ncbi:MAG TPA: 2,3-bisphosphoglycerate-independent phosphoglycerate mutase, partial [Alphaproteobacteria bacterium]|nr:2,3-bisphosphoglycerate-independent phosphoglycerate mutase [Alphaproteobacteria bacterium]
TAALAAVETVDRALGRVLAAVETRGGVLLITADHGNIERMRDEASAQPHTAHTSNRVPVVLAGLRDPALRLRDGGLCDVAPTILALMGLEQPRAMTGRSLLVEERVPHRAGAHAALG